jgi:hypothetical protein
MPHFPSRACALACALAVFPASFARVPDLVFEQVCSTKPEDLIDFVEVVEEGPQSVRLVVYHDRRTRKLQWETDGSPKDSPVGLESGYELLVSEGGRVLGFHALTSRVVDQKPELKALLGTALHFFKGPDGEIEPPPRLEEPEAYRRVMGQARSSLPAVRASLAGRPRSRSSAARTTNSSSVVPSRSRAQVACRSAVMVGWSYMKKPTS